MIYSRSAEYAIRAFVHLAQVPEGKYAMVKNIAEQEEIPAHFLAKILQQLARKGLLRSSKGPTGGFALRVDAGRDPAARHRRGARRAGAVPTVRQRPRPSAPTTCRAPCTIAGSPSVRVSWIIWGGTTIADLAKALEQKKKTLAATKQRKARSAVAAKRA